ncbi:helix-turn-helix domain-containing protein [Methylobacterium flocculans]|uniref:helix-turn-helix domain-containing protein n=1 Tax=Methylobacterium flocculans TaxID=2984843 RepID=UPI0021F27BDA|nr:helix-turn-helix domain-containing protein [Methylobacterium sp. FF17]
MIQATHSPDETPLAFGIVQAAQVAGIGRSTVFEEINAGRLKARKAGRRTLILRDDLAAWLASLPQRTTVAL